MFTDENVCESIKKPISHDELTECHLELLPSEAQHHLRLPKKKG